MQKYFLFSAFIALLLHLGGMSGADLHGALLGYLDAHRASLLLSGLLSGLGVFVLAFLFSAMGAFPIVLRWSDSFTSAPSFCSAP